MLEERELEDFDDDLFASLKSGKKTKQKDPAEAKPKLFEINDDDLLDLLSDGEDNGVVKPKGKSDRIIPPVKTVSSQDNANLIPVSLPQHSLNSDEDSLESNKEDITIPYEPSSPASNPAVSKGTGVRPILKTPTNVGTGQVERKKSSVHFVEKQPESAQIKEDNSKSNSRKKSIDFSDGKPTESKISLVTSSSIVNTLVSSNNIASNSTALSSTVTPIPHMSLSSVDSVISSAPTLTTATSETNNPILNSISKTSSSDSLAVSQANSLLSNNIGFIDISSSDASVRNEDPLQFGSYTPSNTPGRISSSRRSQSLPNTESLFKRPSRIDSLLTVSPNPESKAGSIDQLATTITSTPMTQVYPSTPSAMAIPSTSEGHNLSQPLSFTASPVQDSSIATTVVSAIPFASVPVTTIQQNHTTPMMSDVAFNTRNSSVVNLEKKIDECRALLEKSLSESQQTFSLLQSTQTKLGEAEKEKSGLMVMLEKGKSDLQTEKQLRLDEHQLANDSMKSLRKELEESMQSKEEKLQKQLKETIERYCNDISRLKHDHEESLSHWRDLLSHEQKNRRDEINRLQDNQQKLMELLHSMDSRTSSSYKKLLEEVSDTMQHSVKQISDKCSNLVTTHNLQQTLEVIYDRLDAKQRECLHPLIQKVEEHLWKLENSLLSERKKVEDERAKMFLQIQHDREALQKSKEHFFSEQQAWLSDIFTEKQHITRLQSKANETFTRNQKVETELSCLKACLDQERLAISFDQTKLLKERQELDSIRAKLDQDRQALLALDQNLRAQLLQVNKSSQHAQDVQADSQHALIAARRMQEELNRKLTELQQRETMSLSEINIENENPIENPEASSLLQWLPDDCFNSTGGDVSVLLELEQSQRARNVINEYEKDNEILEKESQFLQQLSIERRSKQSLK